MPSISERFKNAWNAFSGRDPTMNYIDLGSASSYRPDKLRTPILADRSIITAVTTRIAIDVASMTIEHARIDEDGNYKKPIDSGLNDCLTFSANIDQTGRAFMQDAVMSMFDEGVVAIVPTDITFTTSNVTMDPEVSQSFDIDTMRTGQIIQWYPKHVKVRIYNENTGRKEDIVVAKSYCAIVENPLYAIMNEPNSTLQRLIRTYNDLDKINSQNSSGKMDLIVQLPYLAKTPIKQEQAEHRRKLIENQLVNSKYGIAYIDGNEKITQLNRPLENNLWAQAKELQQMLYNQLGLTQSVFDGTADEATMLNYYSRTIEPIVGAFADEMKRKFLSRKAITTGQSIVYFRDPFKLVPVSQVAEIADKFTRNEILSPNELRGIIGYKPKDDGKSDDLRNRNLNQSNEELAQQQEIPQEVGDEETEESNSSTDQNYIQELMNIIGS